MRGYYLNKKYKITLQEYEEFFKKQNGLCAICETNIFKKKLAVDHCHLTGKNRGLLCLRCNIGLGYFKDNKDILLKAVEYLNKHNT